MGARPAGIKVGEQIRRWVAVVDLPQKTLAERLGVSPVSVSRWLRGHRTPSPAMLRRIMKELAAAAEAQRSVHGGAA